MPSTFPRIFTIGHSNQSIESFIALLKTFEIEVLVDVRSYPYSKFAPQFDKHALKTAITTAGLKYLFLGEELGGRPAETEFYDANGRVLYSAVAESPIFLAGIMRLETGTQKYRVAIMCSEENPIGCHRHLLVARVLTKRGIAVEHIRGDGTYQREADLNYDGAKKGQQTLFETQELIEWKSIQSVLHKRPQQSSSSH